MVLASRGRRDLGNGVEPVTDPGEARRLRAKAIVVLAQSAALALAGAGLALLL